MPLRLLCRCYHETREYSLLRYFPWGVATRRSPRGGSESPGGRPRRPTGRENFDDEVGSEFGEADGSGVLRPTLPDERDLGTTHRVRIPGKRKAGFRIDSAELVRVYMIADFTAQLCGNGAVATARRFANDEHDQRSRSYGV